MVCGASNLSVDNILERLIALPGGPKEERLKITRVGHPARVMANQDILDMTLEVKANRSDGVIFVFVNEGHDDLCICQATLARDVKNELQVAMDSLAGKGKGAKGKRPRGLERKKLWEDVRALRKEYVSVLASFFPSL